MSDESAWVSDEVRGLCLVGSGRAPVVEFGSKLTVPPSSDARPLVYHSNHQALSTAQFRHTDSITYIWIANCSIYCTDYIIYLYTHCNFICGLSHVIIKTFSQSVSQSFSDRRYLLLSIAGWWCVIQWWAVSDPCSSMTIGGRCSWEICPPSAQATLPPCSIARLYVALQLSACDSFTERRLMGVQMDLSVLNEMCVAERCSGKCLWDAVD